MRCAGLGLVILLCVGCKGGVLAPWAIPARVEQTFEAPGPLLEALAERRGQLADLTARARLTLRTPEQDLSADHALVIRGRRSLRLETLSPLGQPIGILVAAGNHIRWVDPFRARYWEGPSSRDTIERFTGVPLDLEELVAILAGTIPPVADTANLRLEQESGENAYRLLIPEGPVASRQVVVVSRRDLTVLSRTRYDANGREVLRVKNGRFRPIEGYTLPLLVEVDLPQRHLSLTVDYQLVKVNQGAGEDVFELPIPPGAQRMVLE